MSAGIEFSFLKMEPNHEYQEIINIPFLLKAKGKSKKESLQESSFDKETVKRIKDRVKSIGITNIVNTKNILAMPTDQSSCLAHLENRIISNGKKLKRKISHYTKKDYEKAINYLETIIFYIAQKNLWKRKYDYDARDSFEKRITNTIYILEKNLKYLIKIEKDKKLLLKAQYSQLENKINKILSQDVEKVDRLTYGNKIKLALSILKKFT